MMTTSNDTAKTPYRVKLFEGQATSSWETMVHHPNGRIEFVPGGWATIRWMWNLIKTHPDVQIVWVRKDGTEEVI